MTTTALLTHLPDPLRRRTGFTLIELLTVIAILGLLAGIIIPTLGSMRMKADRTASASNLRQWASALMLFSNDNNGRIPYEGDKDQPSWSDVDADESDPGQFNAWYNQLPPYAEQRPLHEVERGEEGVMLMTSSIHYSPGAEPDARENRRYPQFSYMMNSQIYSGHENAPSNSGADLIRINSIREPSKTIFMTETRASTDDGAPNESSDRIARSKGRNNSISFRYGGRTNVVFLDGSVTTVDSDKLYNGSRDPASSPANQLPGFLWFPWHD
ncbi:MAG: type II secretion system protein [Puniceicoccaceae bacterium]